MKTFFRQLFLRSPTADDISEFPVWRIGLSCAASWSWGVSIAVAIAILHSKGIIPFAAWLTGNVLSLPLFGIVRKYFPASKHWVRFTPILLLFIIVEFFAITLNLQAIRSVLGGDLELPTYPLLSGTVATTLVISLGLAIVLVIYKWGLRISVLTDVGQYGVQLLGTVCLAIVCLVYGERHELVLSTQDGREWLITGFLGIVTGALGTGHQWQRFGAIDERNALAVGLWGGLFFGAYMVFVCITGVFLSDSPAASVLFLLIILSVATSTIDSAVGGLQYLFKRVGCWLGIGSIVAVIAVVGWPLVVDAGLTEIWTVMARIRYPVVLIALSITVVYQVVKSPKSESVLRRLRIVIADPNADSYEGREGDERD